MSQNLTNTYETDLPIAEIYDQVETQTDDVELIRSLIEGRGGLRILEPFCGTGRILIPLALDGHQLVGIDQAKCMLDRAREKIADLAQEVRESITLIQADVTKTSWPQDFHLVILGANCFYELASPEEQEGCIASAAAALRPGGYVYLDNNHMEGDLADSWRQPCVTKGFPTGTCSDGTRVEGACETTWYDAKVRLVRFRRAVTVTRPDGSTMSKEWTQQKHPPSTDEMRTWLGKHGFVIEHLYGDRSANPYIETSHRAIFWARKKGNNK